MGLKKLLRKERDLEDDLGHYNFQINECDNDSDSILEEASKAEAKLFSLRQKIVKTMEKDLTRRRNWIDTTETL